MCMTLEEELGVMAYLLTQYNLKPGLCKFGTRGEKAALKEMPQLHIMDMWMPMEAGKLSREQRMRALSLLLFLKEKQTEDIKGRACINGAPQRAYIPKEDTASPTSVDGIDVHYWDDHNKGKKESEVLQRAQRIRQHRHRQGRHNGAKGGTS